MNKVECTTIFLDFTQFIDYVYHVLCNGFLAKARRMGIQIKILHTTPKPMEFGNSQEKVI